MGEEEWAKEREEGKANKLIESFIYLCLCNFICISKYFMVIKFQLPKRVLWFFFKNN